jgi:hypothetical protein
MSVRLWCPEKGRAFTLRTATWGEVEGRRIRCPACRGIHEAQAPEGPPRLPPASRPRRSHRPTLSKPKWSTPIGVISIVFGCLGILGVLLNFVNPQAQKIMRHFPEWYQSFATIISPIAGVLTSGWLIAAGEATLKLRPYTRVLNLLYAFVQVVWLAVSMSLLHSVMGEAADQLSGLEAAAMRMAATVGWVGLAYPVFLLVWFFRRTVAEQIERWNSPPRD